MDCSTQAAIKSQAGECPSSRRLWRSSCYFVWPEITGIPKQAARSGDLTSSRQPDEKFPVKLIIRCNWGAATVASHFTGYDENRACPTLDVRLQERFHQLPGATACLLRVLRYYFYESRATQVHPRSPMLLGARAAARYQVRHKRAICWRFHRPLLEAGTEAHSTGDRHGYPRGRRTVATGSSVERPAPGPRR